RTWEFHPVGAEFVVRGTKGFNYFSAYTHSGKDPYVEAIKKYNESVKASRSISTSISIEESNSIKVSQSLSEKKSTAVAKS
ncbi:hypothetical protein WL551_13315, partial [Staphylococcus hominis]